MKLLSAIVAVFLWPGTKLVERMGIDPESDMGMMRSLFNSIIWTALGLAIVMLFVL